MFNTFFIVLVTRMKIVDIKRMKNYSRLSENRILTGALNMTSKERMQTAMEHQEPDRVPYMATFVPEVEFILKEKYRKELEGMKSNVEIKYQGMTELDLLFGHDMLLLTYGMSTGYYRDTDSDTYKDEWGITWRKIPYDTWISLLPMTPVSTVLWLPTRMMRIWRTPMR